MSRRSVLALVAAVFVVGLGIIAFLLGNGLMPSKAEAIEKGTYAPWLIVWLMIAVAAVCAGALAAFLVNYGVKGDKRGRA